MIRENISSLDFYAGQALQSLIVYYLNRYDGLMSKIESGELAQVSFLIAEKMMEEKQRREKLNFVKYSNEIK